MIEFAICMPILIIMLFYINDLVKIKRYCSQTEFVAQQFINIIQNISQKRINKIIDIDDIKRAIALSHLTIYPGTTMFHNGKGYGLCHRPELFITYVKGETDGTASCKWVCHAPTGDKTSPETLVVEKEIKASKGSSLNFAINVSPFVIHPSLKINPGEVKIIIESAILFKSTYTNYNGYKPGSSRKAFGYFLLTPKPKMKPSEGEHEWYYHSVVIFTPKPGLFSETPPS